MAVYISHFLFAWKSIVRELCYAYIVHRAQTKYVTKKLRVHIKRSINSEPHQIIHFDSNKSNFNSRKIKQIEDQRVSLFIDFYAYHLMLHVTHRILIDIFSPRRYHDHFRLFVVCFCFFYCFELAQIAFTPLCPHPLTLPH